MLTYELLGIFVIVVLELYRITKMKKHEVALMKRLDELSK